MKQYLIVLILLLSSSSLFWMNGVSYFQVKQAKRHIKKLLAENKIEFDQTVTFHVNELKEAVWIEPREFRLNGNMYDVFKTDTVNGFPVYHCFLDKNESVWVDLLLSANQYSETTTPNSEKKPLRYLMKDLYKILNAKLLPTLYFNTISNEFISISCYSFQPIGNLFQPPEKHF